MEDDSKASSIDVELKQSEKENVVEQGSGEKEEASLDGESVKVEKESLDEKESSNLLTSTDESTVSLNVGDLESANSASDLNLPLEGRDEEFQLQSKTVNPELELLNTKEALDVKENSNFLEPTVETTVSSNAEEFGLANSASDVNLPLEAEDRELELQPETIDPQIEVFDSKESLGVKESSSLFKTTVRSTESSNARELGSPNSASDINLPLEAAEKDLEFQLESIDPELKVLDLKESFDKKEKSNFLKPTIELTANSNAEEVEPTNSASGNNLPLEEEDKDLEFQLKTVNPEIKGLDSKESLDAIESSDSLKSTVESTGSSNTEELGSANSASGINLLQEMEDKEIEFQLETVNPELKYSEDTLLRFEVTNDEKINNEFKLGKEVLNDQIPGTEQSCNFDLEEFDALLSDDIKQQNNVDVNEAFNSSQCNTRKMTMENIKENEAELAKPAGDVHSVEELYKPIGTQEELESIRTVGLEVEVTNDRLEKINNEFKLEKEVLNDQIPEAEQSHNFDLEELHAFSSDDIKQQNIIDINKALNVSWCDEQKMPMQNTKEIEAELAKSVGDVHSVEELYKSIGTQEELESIRAMGLEVDVTNDGLEKINNEFKFEKEVLNDQIPEAEQSHNFDLEELDAFLSDDIKQQNIVDINEALNVGWCDEQKMPMENIKETEADLAKSVSDVHSVEELYKPIGTRELESQRTMGLEVVTNDGLEKINNEFKLGKEVLNDQILEAEQSHNFDLEEHDALLPDGIKQQNIVDVNEALNGSWSDKQEISMENIKEIEAELAKSAGDVHSVEELYKPIGTQEELESIRAMGSDKLEIDKVKAKKMEDEIIKIGNELTQVHTEVEENNEATTRTQSRDLSSKTQVHTESRDISSKTQVRSPKNLLSFSKEDLKAKLMYLDEIERNLKEKDKESPKSTTENKAFQGTVEDFKIKLLLKEEYCIQLEAKLHWTSKNLAKTESLLKEALSSKHELEQVLAEKGAERQKLEDLTTIQSKSLSEYENLVSALQNEVKSLRSKLEDVEEKLEASGVQEKELHEKLRYARDELEQQLKATEEASTRYLDLKTLHETSTKNLELELEEADKNFKQKVYEAKELQEKLKSLEDHIDYFKSRAIETAQRFTSLKTEMESNATKVLSFVHNIEDIKQKASNDAKFQRELKEKKDLEWEALLKKSRDKLKAKHQYATVLEKQVKGLEKKLQEAESQYKVKAAKQSEELSLVNEEVIELREKFSQTSETKKKISELEEKLKPAFTSGEEASSTKANNNNIESEIKEVKSRFLDIAKLLERKNKKGKALEISLKQASHVSVKPFCPKALRIILVLTVITLIVGVILQKIHHYD